MSSTTTATTTRERWVPEELEEDVHATVAKAPRLVANNRPMIEAAQRVIQEYQEETRDPHASLTLRQIFYQLIEKIGLANDKASYGKLGDVLTAARLQRVIPCEHISDRSRSMLSVGMWGGIADFAGSAYHAYRGDVWEKQEQRVLC